jgi:hypothetical protein
MIALRKSVRRKTSPTAWHDGFMAMVPRIRQYARLAFRGLDEEAQEDAIAETIANALVAYVRLFEQGKVNSIFPDRSMIFEGCCSQNSSDRRSIPRNSAT